MTEKRSHAANKINHAADQQSLESFILLIEIVLPLSVKGFKI